MMPGSGVGSELKKSVSVGLHFFNFFNVRIPPLIFGILTQKSGRMEVSGFFSMSGAKPM